MAKRGTVPQRTARQMIREALWRGLVPGDRLASEPVLLNYFEISRASLREALRVLSFLGAVDVRSGPGGGAQIAMPQSRIVASALAMALQFRSTTLRTLMEAREAMEPAIASLAATRRKDQDLAALEGCLQRLAGAAEAEDIRRENHRFHQLIATAGGNEVFGLLIPALTSMSTTMERSDGAWRKYQFIEEYTEILAAIRDRDSAAAHANTAELFRRELEYLEQHHPQQLAARVLWPDVDELLETDLRKDEEIWTQ